MKRYSKFLLFATVLASGFASCADEDIVEYVPEVKPDELLQDEKFNQYDALKSYVDRTTSPNFKLGAGVTVSSFLEQKQEFVLVTTNFDEMTAGNAMKYASVVSDKGEMNFATVKSFVEMAEKAGLTVYGHTLAWHAQQNNKYLNSLLADKEIEMEEGATQTVEDAVFDYSTFAAYNYWGQKPDGADISIVNGVLTSVNPAAIPNFWEFQYHVADGISWNPEISYTVSMMIRGSEPGSFTCTAGTWGGQATSTIELSTEWKEVSFTAAPGVSGGGFVMFQSGNYAGTIEVQWLKVTHEEAMAISWWTPIITNGDAEGTETDNMVSTHVGGSNGACDIIDGVGMNGSRAFVVTSAGGATNTWDTQFFLTVGNPLSDGDKVKIAFDYRADVPNNSESQTHATPGAYLHWDAGCAVSFTAEWQHFEKVITINSTMSPEGNMQTIAWNLDVGAPAAPANKYYFDNIEFYIEESGNTIPLTPEEKRDTLTWAIDNWIRGMMQATAGKVTAWDAINEPLSGTDLDGDGFYDLQSASRGTVSADDAKNNFYWQDYLGDENYVRLVIQKARTYYAEYGGTEPLRLFINDYNLESDWDDNAKLKSLIHWINVWEADGETKIDGIATQMHVSCYADQTIQESKKAHVEKMLKLMAETRKLVKISELDMGYIDESGNPVATDKMTPEQHQAMADYYQFIVQKYFEIIPADQQYGITQWCITDAPGALGTGWRGGEPVGLWNLNYQRKCTYEGFIKGLQGNAN